MGFSALIQQAAAAKLLAQSKSWTFWMTLRCCGIRLSSIICGSFLKCVTYFQTRDIKKEAIVDFTKNTPELAGKFKYSEDGIQIRLDTKKSKIAFLKLMNDAFCTLN